MGAAEDREEMAAARAGYDAIAEATAERWRDDLATKPLDRGMLAAFAERVAADGGGRVAEIGCGTGRITAHLRDLGLDVTGVDLSPGMIRVARKEHPDLRFFVGSLTAVGLPDRSLAGVVAWYSLIHVPPALLRQALEELARVTKPGGHLLAAFQVGDEPHHVTDAWGHQVDLVFRRLQPGEITAQLDAPGFSVHAHLHRGAEGLDSSPQSFLLAHRR